MAKTSIYVFDKPSLVYIMGCCLFSTKPLSGPCQHINKKTHGYKYQWNLNQCTRLVCKKINWNAPCTKRPVCRRHKCQIFIGDREPEYNCFITINVFGTSWFKTLLVTYDPRRPTEALPYNIQRHIRLRLLYIYICKFTLATRVERSKRHFISQLNVKRMSRWLY